MTEQGIQLLYNSNHHTPSSPIYILGPSKKKQTSKPHTCPQCPLSFTRAHNLRSHLTTHSTDRPHQCDRCSAQFRRQHDLKRHQKLHTGERPFVCEFCSRSFSRSDALHRHQRVDGAIRCSMANRHTILPFQGPSKDPPTPELTASPQSIPSPELPSLFLQRTLPPPSVFRTEPHLDQLQFDQRRQIDRLTSQVHDLQIENNLLRSLVLGKTIQK